MKFSLTTLLIFLAGLVKFNSLLDFNLLIRLMLNLSIDNKKIDRKTANEALSNIRLRLQRFAIRFDEESRSGTLVRWNLLLPSVPKVGISVDHA